MKHCDHSQRDLTRLVKRDPVVATCDSTTFVPPQNVSDDVISCMGVAITGQRLATGRSSGTRTEPCHHHLHLLPQL